MGSSTGGTSWTAVEVQLLFDWYEKKGPKWCLSRLPGRTMAQVKGKAHLLKLKFRQVKNHIDEEVKRLHTRGHNDYAIARRLMTSTDTVRRSRIRQELPVIGVAEEGHLLMVSKALSRCRREMEERSLEEADRSYKEDESILTERRRKNHSTRINQSASPMFTPEQDELIVAISKFRSKHGRIPTLVEGFRIAKELGWSLPERSDEGTGQ